MKYLYSVLSLAWLGVSAWYHYDGSWFQGHPVFMNLGIFGIGYAIWLERYSFNHQKHYNHMILHLLSALSMFFAFYVIWTNKEAKGKAHFTTWHAWFGAGVLIWLASQALVGSWNMNPNKTPKEREPHKKDHTLYGFLLFIFFHVTTITAYAKYIDFSNLVWDAKLYMFIAYSFVALCGIVALYK